MHTSWVLYLAIGKINLSCMSQKSSFALYHITEYTYSINAHRAIQLISSSHNTNYSSPTSARNMEPVKYQTTKSTIRIFALKLDKEKANTDG